MRRGERGYEPAPGQLAEQLSKMVRFHEPGQPLFTTPLTQFERRISYEILEWDPLLDSSNMGMTDWVHLAEDIERNYADFDAFVVLHGTDTMAYTASALSFMLVNLGKTVVLTGSQIPLFEVRNDAIDNLLGALTIAGHFEIPEVCLYFHNKLMRGNRTQKVDALGLNAFHSGNLSPLVEVGIQLDVHWHRVRAAPMDPLKVRTITERNVACLRIFPGITAEILQNFMLQPLQGVIIETFGAGNAPDVRPDFLEVLRKASDRGVVIVNVTQCHRGGATIDYATGQSLAEVGVVSGLDMTPEAALSKLSYLLSQPELDRDDVCRLMQVSLRGELTEPHREHIFSFAKGREAEI
jgi:lysophospholipase